MADTLGIRFERKGGLAVAILDRQQALNALDRPMMQALSQQLPVWREDPGVAAVLVKAAPGRAFCAGGDIRLINDAVRNGQTEQAVAFYREEYRMNWRIRRFPKPYIALLDGIVMGGGVGISIHGSHRVVSERVQFAMPETGIGFFPDVGATYFLPRCPGQTGTWLGLTGSRLGAADCLELGIGTHGVASARLPELEEALAGAAVADIDATIQGFAGPMPGAAVAGQREAIDRCFGGSSLPAIVAALEQDRSAFGPAALEQLAGRSPLSLAVTLVQLRRGADLTFEEAMQLEYRLARHFMAGSDFPEGVRALLIDKDRQPRWRYPDVGSVPPEVVEGYFRPLPGDELALDWQGL